MNKKQLINVLGFALHGIYVSDKHLEIDKLLEEEYGISFIAKEKATLAEASQVLPEPVQNVPLVQMLPVEKPKKVKHFVPQNVGKSVKRSQKPLYRYRRR